MFGPAFLANWLGVTFREPGGRVLRILTLSYLVFLPVRGVALPALMGVGKAGWPTIAFFAAGLFLSPASQMLKLASELLAASRRPSTRPVPSSARSLRTPVAHRAQQLAQARDLLGTQLLDVVPNGNLVVQGKRETSFSHEQQHVEPLLSGGVRACGGGERHRRQ